MDLPRILSDQRKDGASQPKGPNQALPPLAQPGSRENASLPDPQYNSQLPPLASLSYLMPGNQSSYVPPVLIPNKRPIADESHPWEPPPKKQSKWTEEEDDLIITLRGEGTKWEEIAKHIPGRSAIACRLHYQNFLQRRAGWDEEKKNKLAQLYNRSVTAYAC